MTAPATPAFVTLPLIRRTAVALLAGATAAGPRVYTPRDWPVGTRVMPCLLVRPASDDLEAAVQRGQAPAFTATGTLEIYGEVNAPALAEDQGAQDAELAIEVFERQVRQVLVGNPALMQLLQQIPFIRTEYDFSSEGGPHFAAFKTQLGVEYFADPCSFYRPTGPRLAGLDFKLTGYPNAGTSVDLSDD